MLKFAVFGALVILGYVEAEVQFIRLAPEKTSMITKEAIYCAAEEGVNPMIVLQIKNKKYSEDETIKKFLMCVFNRLGMTSKKGVIKVDKLADIYPDTVDKEALKNVMRECQQEEGEPHDRVFKFFKCYQENTPVRISLMRH